MHSQKILMIQQGYPRGVSSIGNPRQVLIPYSLGHLSSEVMVTLSKIIFTNKPIHWIWISQRNPFDGDSPYSFDDLFARV